LRAGHDRKLLWRALFAKNSIKTTDTSSDIDTTRVAGYIDTLVGENVLLNRRVVFIGTKETALMIAG
jgi:hypothetical protein